MSLELAPSFGVGVAKKTIKNGYTIVTNCRILDHVFLSLIIQALFFNARLCSCGWEVPSIQAATHISENPGTNTATILHANLNTVMPYTCDLTGSKMPSVLWSKLATNSTLSQWPTPPGLGWQSVCRQHLGLCCFQIPSRH